MAADHFANLDQFGADLWKLADALRANSGLASNEYFMPILGLLFLRHASNRYYAAHDAIAADQAAGRMPKRPLRDADFTQRRAMNLPKAARYDVILNQPKDGSLGHALTAAMEAVEARFPPLAGQLPKDYEKFDDDLLESMMRKFDTDALRTAGGDVFGRIYEYFLAEFSKQGAHDNGEFFTPPSIVQTIVNVIEPDHGIVLDPACGSGGMFVQSSHFIEAEGADTMQRVTFYGHEKNETTAKLAQINLAVHGLEPYSERDDIIVLSDEAHRTQAGRLARNMRVALPNAAFIGFTGTPLFKQDELTRRIFGDYVSRYDFKRSEQDGATVKLVYENRGEKLGVACADLNARIADKIEEAELDPDQQVQLEKLLGKDYEIITADERLDRIAADFVEHCATRWQSGKALFVCVDKITCARMYQRIVPRWLDKANAIRAEAEARKRQAQAATDADRAVRLQAQADRLREQVAWMDSTLIEIVISEAQNEVADFKRWGFDIVPHRARMKQGFEIASGERLDLEKAFKKPDHPFRIAIVCAMWLTGFDVECLSTLYLDKPMKAHTLMQAIARANRVYPGKDFGLIVDYNGMLKSLREALAQYALGDDGNDGDDIVVPIEERVQALIEALEATEAYLRDLGFDPAQFAGASGFARTALFRDAVEAVYTSDTAKRRFEVLARQVFTRFKALLTEPTTLQFAERHDNIEAVYKKLIERRDTADVTAVLKELHRIVNAAIRTETPGDDQTAGLTFDLSKINMEKLRDEFAKKVKHKATALKDIREIVEAKLAQMLGKNATRMDYQKRYEDIVADYNNDKNRVTIEETFRRLMELADGLDEEQNRHVREGLSEEELALFDLLKRDDLSKGDRERVKQAGRDLLAAIQQRLGQLDRFWEKEQTKSDVEVFILDKVYADLPTPPFTAADKEAVAAHVYQHVWQQALRGDARFQQLV